MKTTTSVETKLEANWSGNTLSEVVKFDDKTFKIVTGLRNGGGENTTYILGTTGWANFLNRNDIPTESTKNSINKSKFYIIL